MDLTYCSPKPECIVTTNPDRSVLIMIITYNMTFQFRPMNVSILHLKYYIQGEIQYVMS